MTSGNVGCVERERLQMNAVNGGIGERLDLCGHPVDRLTWRYSGAYSGSDPDDHVAMIEE